MRLAERQPPEAAGFSSACFQAPVLGEKNVPVKGLERTGRDFDPEPPGCQSGPELFASAWLQASKGP